MKKSKKGTWPQAIVTLALPLLGVFIFRWIFFEPFVIPSGSMIPTLLVHDHILVNKLAYGIHNPFSKSWWIRWGAPKRGDIAVFRYPDNPDVYYVKRIVGLPHDHVHLEKHILSINDVPQDRKTLMGDPTEFAYSGQGDEEVFHAYRENGHLVRYRGAEEDSRYDKVFDSGEIPEGKFFAMGDNRDQSSDSRVWGFVPIDNFVGRVALIWLSCDRTLESSPLFCDPRALRLQRMFTEVR